MIVYRYGWASEVLVTTGTTAQEKPRNPKALELIRFRTYQVFKNLSLAFTSWGIDKKYMNIKVVCKCLEDTYEERKQNEVEEKLQWEAENEN